MLPFSRSQAPASLSDQLSASLKITLPRSSLRWFSQYSEGLSLRLLGMQRLGRGVTHIWGLISLSVFLPFRRQYSGSSSNS